MLDGENENSVNIVIDNGSGYIRAGLSGEEIPRVEFPSFVGYPKYSNAMVGSDQQKYYLGKDAEANRGVLKLDYPIEHGEIKNIDYMVNIFTHIFKNELGVSINEHNVIINECSKHTKENRETIAKIMFETFKVNGLYIANPGLLNLYSVGRSTGISVDLGDGVSQYIPVLESNSLPYAIILKNFGGRELTEYMIKNLQGDGQSFITSAEKEIAKNIKEKTGYVALDYEDELKNIEPFEYELPDGKHLIIKDQRIKFPEILFRPDIAKNIKLGDDICNIAEACFNSIQKCDYDIRKDLYNNIFLSGGTSLFNGLPERFKKEIKAFAPESMKEEVKVIASPERRYASWIGDSILSSISKIESLWVTKSEYEESGVDIFIKKGLNLQFLSNDI